MTKESTVVMHAKVSGVTVPTSSDGGTVLFANQTVELDAAAVERTRDRNGISWLDMTADEQLARYGEVRFGLGPAPEGAVIGADDSMAMHDQRREEEENLKFIADAQERAAAAASIRKRYGFSNPSHQFTSKPRG